VNLRLKNEFEVKKRILSLKSEFNLGKVHSDFGSNLTHLSTLALCQHLTKI
jgi:hypothetical protein